MAKKLSDQITALLGDTDWVIVHDGHELLAATDLDEREKDSRPPKDTCNRCGQPATRLSSFGEDYYKHEDGTVHERVC